MMKASAARAMGKFVGDADAATCKLVQGTSAGAGVAFGLNWPLHFVASAAPAVGCQASTLGNNLITTGHAVLQVESLLSIPAPSLSFNLRLTGKALVTAVASFLLGFAFARPAIIRYPFLLPLPARNAWSSACYSLHIPHRVRPRLVC